MIQFNDILPEKEDWYRHIICHGVEINCYSGQYERSTFNKAKEVVVVIRNDEHRFPKTEKGLRDMNQFIWQLSTVFHAGMAFQQHHIQKALGIK